MAVEDFLISMTEGVNDLAVKLGSLGRWVQALGLLVFLWILVQSINFIIVFRRSSQSVKEGKPIRKSDRNDK